MAGYDSQARPGPFSMQLEKKATAKSCFFCVLGPETSFRLTVKRSASISLHYRKITAGLPEVYDFSSVTPLFSFPLDDWMTRSLLVKPVSQLRYGNRREIDLRERTQNERFYELTDT
jgi:hypothetical protein